MNACFFSKPTSAIDSMCRSLILIDLLQSFLLSATKFWQINKITEFPHFPLNYFQHFYFTSEVMHQTFILLCFHLEWFQLKPQSFLRLLRNSPSAFICIQHLLLWTGLTKLWGTFNRPRPDDASHRPLKPNYQPNPIIRLPRSHISCWPATNKSSSP